MRKTWSKSVSFDTIKFECDEKMYTPITLWASKFGPEASSDPSNGWRHHRPTTKRPHVLGPANDLSGYHGNSHADDRHFYI